jgi:hypothetical protein
MGHLYHGKLLNNQRVNHNSIFVKLVHSEPVWRVVSRILERCLLQMDDPIINTTPSTTNLWKSIHASEQLTIGEISQLWC